MQQTLTIPAGALYAALDAALSCADTKRHSGREVLNAIHIVTTSAGLIIEGADGYRLARTTIEGVEIEHESGEPTPTVDLLIASTPLDRGTSAPVKDCLPALKKAARGSASVLLTIDDASVSVRIDAATWIFQRVDGSYPDTRKLIPKPAETGARFAANGSLVAEVLAALARHTGGGMVRIYPGKTSKDPFRITARDLGENWRTEAVIMPMFTQDWD